MIKNLKKTAAGAVITMSLCMAASVMAFAGEVEPSGLNTIADKKAIQAELDETGSVTLIPGQTYHLTGPLYVKSGMHIEATGATITADKDLFMNQPDKAGYSAITNFSVNGGTWLFSSSKGFDKSSVKLAHGQNIRLTNMTVNHNNYSGHGFEIIACKDVLIENCTLTPVGNPPKSSVEEMIQLDIAASKTAPYVYALNHSLTNGACCQNVTIKGCTITGCRGICANFASSKEDEKYLSKFHSNINIINCNITGAVSEGVMLYNVTGGKITGNTIISKNPKRDNSRAVGLHIGSYANGKTKKMVISNNTIKGKMLAIQFWPLNAKFKKLTISKNKVYAAGTTIDPNAVVATNKYVVKKNKDFSY